MPPRIVPVKGGELDDAKKEGFIDWFFICLVFSVLAVFLAITIARGLVENRWRRELIERGYYEWTIDPQTGDREFSPIAPEKKEEQ